VRFESRRRLALLFLFLFLVPATGASAELVSCDDCLQMAVFSCCALETSEDDCEERCGSCEDDTTVSVRAVLTREGSQTKASVETAWALSVQNLINCESITCVATSPPPSPLRATIPHHIPTTVILA